MYGDSYYYGAELDEEFFLILAGILGGVILVAVAIGVLTYVFQSVGLYAIAKRRGIRNPWLAWLPVGNYWIAGSISDQYRYVTRGEVKNRRTILLVLSIVGLVLSGSAAAISSSQMLQTLQYIAADDMGGLLSATGTGLTGSLVSLAQSGVQIALLVFWHMALYDLYSSCDSRYSVVFLVLGIIFGFTVPFFIFANRKKDYGMPPRRQESQPEPGPKQRDYKDPWDQ